MISPCWFQIQDANGQIGTLAEPDRAYVQAAKKSGMKIWPLVTNGSFDPELTAKLLENPAGRQRAAAELVRLVKEYGLDGINFDFENIRDEDRDKLTRFVGELSGALHQAGTTVSMDVTVPTDTANWSRCYDRAALAQAVDYLMLMAYDEHTPGATAAGSVASLPWVERGIAAVLTEGVPAEKLVLGMPLYMRLWRESGGEVQGRTLHMDEAQSLWQEKKASRRWLEDCGQYYYAYHENGSWYRVWQEDARSLALKGALIRRYDLAGAALWKKGVETPDVWPVVAAAVQ